MRVLVSTLLAAHTAASAAAVPTGSMTPVDQLFAPHRLRSGIALGLAVGGGLAGASGYPNDAVKIGDPSYYSAGGLMLGTGESLFLMGALTDYLSFGFWYAHAAASNANWQSTGNGGGLRVEAFPLVAIFPSLGGLGVSGAFGVGTAKLSSKRPGVATSEGTQSFAATGVFQEWSFGHVLGGHFGAGPSLEYVAIWSLALERHGLLVSARVVFYGGP